MYDIVVLGSINLDIITKCAGFPNHGDTAFCESIYTMPGGKGNNQAVSAAKFGKRVCFIGAVGDDNHGKQLRENLKSKNISDDHIVVKHESETGSCVALVDQDGENTLLVNPGANMDLNSDDISKVFDDIEGKILLVQMETSKESVISAMKKAKEKGMFVILDPAPVDGISKDAFIYADLIVPNSHETKYITNIDVHDELTALEAAKVIKSIGIDNVVIKMGGDGTLLLQKDNSHIFIPAIKVNAVDTVGAGDCFAGAMASYLIDDIDNIVEAVKFAQIVAGIKVSRQGGQDAIPSIEEVEAVKASIIF